jgi:hypothetical protein
VTVEIRLFLILKDVIVLKKERKQRSRSYNYQKAKSPGYLDLSQIIPSREITLFTEKRIPIGAPP